jgi:hypothetical protein
MRKNIVNIAKACLSVVHEKTTSPQEIYNEILSNTTLSPIKKILTPKDAITVCFLAPMIHNGTYKEGIEYAIESLLYSFSIVEFQTKEDEIDCSDCDGNGYNSCDYCYGDGTKECSMCDGSGEEECEACGGDGQDDEGDPCDDCQGGGKVTCNRCSGDGSNECDWCDGDGSVPCDNCNNGKVDVDEFIPLSVNDYFYWNPKYLNFLKQKIYTLTPINFEPENDFIRFNRYFLDHNDLETKNIDESFENGTYVGGIIENPSFFEYGNTSIRGNSPFDSSRFEESDVS